MIRLFWKIKDWWRGVSFGGLRSNKWPEFKKEFEKTHPKECAVCGNKKCDLHHCLPFHISPADELKDENLIWLCEGIGTKKHHFEFGHLFSWSSWNESVKMDSALWFNKIKNRP